jgi:hypothetical protein
MEDVRQLFADLHSAVELWRLRRLIRLAGSGRKKGPVRFPAHYTDLASRRPELAAYAAAHGATVEIV